MRTPLILRTLLLLSVPTLCGCADIPAVAPENATLRLNRSSDSAHTNSDSIIVEATVDLETGDPVGYDAQVTFTTDLGGLCRLFKRGVACGLDSVTGLPSLTVSTSEGVAFAVLRGGGQLGQATLRAKSGDAHDSTSVTLVP